MDAAFIAVPATFTIRQREATEEAAHMAGLTVCVEVHIDTMHTVPCGHAVL